jgi:hypothetical protein
MHPSEIVWSMLNAGLVLLITYVALRRPSLPEDQELG